MRAAFNWFPMINSEMEPIDLDKLQESPNLLDTLIQMEDIMDSMDIYVFKNWLDGEIIEGPVVRRYWLDMTLYYPFDTKKPDNGMPDPKGALRLIKHDIRIDYERAQEADDDFDENDFNEDASQSEEKNTSDWLVRVSIPRRLVVQMASAQHDFYDEEVDIDQVEDAKDSGLDSESAYFDENQPMNSPTGGPQRNDVNDNGVL